MVALSLGFHPQTQNLKTTCGKQLPQESAAQKLSIDSIQDLIHRLKSQKHIDIAGLEKVKCENNLMPYMYM